MHCRLENLIHGSSAASLGASPISIRCSSMRFASVSSVALQHSQQCSDCMYDQRNKDNLFNLFLLCSCKCFASILQHGADMFVALKFEKAYCLSLASLEAACCRWRASRLRC